MAIFGFFLEKKPSGRAKCQICRKPISKEEKAIYISHYFTGDRGYFHDYCFSKIINDLYIVNEEKAS